MKVHQRHVTKQALRYVQIYEGTQRNVAKQALRYAYKYMKVPADM